DLVSNEERCAARAATSAAASTSRLSVSWAPVARLAVMRSAFARRMPVKRCRDSTGTRALVDGGAGAIAGATGGASREGRAAASDVSVPATRPVGDAESVAGAASPEGRAAASGDSVPAARPVGDAESVAGAATTGDGADAD